MVSASASVSTLGMGKALQAQVKGELIEIPHSADLSAGALSWNAGITYRFRLESISIRFSASVSPTVTITLDSKDGADYDTVLRSKSLSTAQNYFESFGEGYEFSAGDDIKIDITSVAATAYIIVRVSKIG